MQFLTSQGYLERIKGLLHTQLPDYTSAQLAYRGTTLPLDPSMTGYTRFGYRLGNTAAVLRSNAWTKLLQPVVQNSTVLYPNDIPLWVDTGVAITIGKQSIHTIDLIDRDNGYLMVEEGLAAPFSADTPLVYHATPIVVDGDHPAIIPNELTFRSIWKVFIGDWIGIEGERAAINSITEYQVSTITQIAYDGTYYTYQALLSEDIPRDILDGERAFLVCNVAYESLDVIVPTTPAAYYQLIGPFVVDWFSGEMLDNVHAEETYTLETYSASGSIINARQTVDKNHVVLKAPLQGSFPLFWNCSRGYLNYSANDRTHLHSEAYPTMETFPLSGLIFDSTGAVTGAANTYYAELRYAPTIELTKVEANSTLLNHTYVSTNIVALDRITISYSASRLNIIASTAGSSVRLTTVVDHGFAVGDEVTVAGHAVAAANGVHLVSAVINARTVELDVTTATDGGVSGTVGFYDKLAHVRTTIPHGLAVGDSFSVVDHVPISYDLNGTHTVVKVLGKYSVQVAVPSGNTVLGVAGYVVPNRELSISYQHNKDDAYGKAFLWTDLAPAWEPTEDWLILLRADSAGVFRVRFYPNDWQQLTLAADTDTYFPVSITPKINILSSALGAPTVITTLAAHGLATGDSIVISGHTGSIPAISGAYTATVIAADQFTIPVAVTFMGMGGTVRKAGEDATRIELVWRGTPGSKVEIGDWSTNGARVRSLKYTVVSSLTGGYQWATTGVLIKPLFLSIDNLRTTLDRDSYNNGSILL